MKLKRIFALALAAALALALAGCTLPAQPTPTPTPVSTLPASPTAAPTDAAPSPTQSAGEVDVVNVLMLKGPTGLGAAKLMADNEAGTTAQKYAFTVDAGPGTVPAKLVSGEVDIAALPTNVAANLYNKDGGIQMLALNTLGVLYILENGNSVNSMADLAGKTLYATGQGANPEFVLNYLLEQNGLDPASDVTVEWKASDELVTLMGTGDVSLAMLPVPAATGVLKKNQDVRAALDLTEEWDRWADDSSVLTMGCVVARKEFVEQHPDAVDTFLAEYAASIAYMTDEANMALSTDANPAQLAAKYEIVPSAAIAADAIPQANLICIAGQDMAAGIQGYYEVLWRADPSSIGGGIPDDGFYYVP